MLQLTRLGVGVVLARLLTPGEYGLAALALLITALLIFVSDLGLGPALIQREDVSSTDISTVFWLNAGAGALLTVLGIVAAPWLADFFRSPAATPLFRAVSLGFLFSGLAATHSALLVREMAFKALEIRLIVATLVAAVVAVVVAWAGYGAWAIIVQQLVLGAVSMALLWYFVPWRPSLVFSAESIREIRGYTAHLFGARLLAYARGNADNALVGRFLGSTALGVYALAFNLMLVPLTRLVAPLDAVLFPALSRIQRDGERVVRIWANVVSTSVIVFIPGMAVLSIASADVVDVVIGARWASAAPVISILALAGAAQAITTPNGTVLQALGRADLVFRMSLGVTAASILAFAVGLHWGVRGVAYAALAMSIVNIFVSFGVVVRTLQVGVRGLLSRFAAPFAVAAFGVGAAVAVHATAVALSHNHIVALAATTLAAVAAVCLAAYVLTRGILIEVRRSVLAVRSVP